MKTHSKNQSGFTLIELLIATTVFSVILLAATATLIQVGRMYYKGVISSKTQNVARSSIETVSRELQFASGEFQPTQTVTVDGVDHSLVCFGNNRFTFIKNRQLSNNNDGRNIKHVLWKDKTPGDCDDSVPNLTTDTPSSNGSELLEENMRLGDFVVDGGNDDRYAVEITVIYGDDDLLSPDGDNPKSCKGSIVGGQWCAFSRLSTQVYRRVE